jgi:hypothetical protein
MRLWKQRVRKVYESLEDLKAWDEIYSICKRLGFSSCEKLWEENPVLCGSVNPEDFAVYKK